MSEQIIPNVVVSMPSQLFTLARKFQAASNGKIFIGKIDTDPTIPENQIQVYLENEDGTTVPVSQPLIINQAGYPVYNGQIAKFVTVQGHSMAVYDSYGAQQFYYPNVLKYDPDQLRQELSSSSGASLVGTESGSNVQTELTDLSIKTNYLYDLVDFVKITDYADLAEGDDWTNAIQEALDTGKPVYGNGTYKVSGKLKSKGQRLIGNWFINATHLYNTFSKVPAVVRLTEKNHIRTIYADMAYDLCELLAMKSLGFNIINHYCNFNAHSSGNGGSVDILLDNAVSAGLYVCLNTEIAINETNLNITLEEYVDRYDGHPSVWGYSVYDEPGTRKISVADQDVKIEKMRKMTSKPLTCVDLVVTTCPPFYDHWSKNYDVFFVDSYAQHYESGTDQDKRDWDKEKNRLDWGGVKAMSRCPKLVPVVGLFTTGGESGQYSKDKSQLIDNSLFFGTKGGGDYGVFVWGSPWDSTSDDRVNNSKDYQDACAKLSQQPINTMAPKTNCYIFGGFPDYHNFGLADLFGSMVVKDPLNKQAIAWSDSYPTALFVSDNSWSGIGFSNVTGNFLTTIKCDRYVSVYFDCFHAQGMNPDTTLQIKLDRGAGINRAVTPEFKIAEKPTFYGSNKWEPAKSGESVLLSISGNKVTENYELIIRGLIVCTDW
ncbi:phage head-binding domain-containing protein [Morganella morganii]|uniref:phage head-binding domain-containing protein n=1 Tax=Morganella morganii TaxID=582 RepID=UPI003EB9E037